jgi:hypothetical protein
MQNWVFFHKTIIIKEANADCLYLTIPFAKAGGIFLFLSVKMKNQVNFEYNVSVLKKIQYNLDANTENINAALAMQGTMIVVQQMAKIFYSQFGSS